MHAKQVVRRSILASVFIGLMAWLGMQGAGAAGEAACDVPSVDYATIQSAVDDAACAKIHIGEGTFFERVTIERPVILRGEGAGKTIVDGGSGGSVFTINGAAVTLRRLGITNGAASGSGGGIAGTDTDLTLEGSRLFKNNASGGGGGLSHDGGRLIVSDAQFEDNDADMGGGLSVVKGTAEIRRTVFLNNESSSHAGAIYLGPDTTNTLQAVTVRGNQSYVDGGGLFNAGSTVIDASSFVDNRSTNYSGGAIRNENGELHLRLSTVSGNSSPIDGIVHNWGGTMRVSSTTIAGNSGSPALEDSDGSLRIKNSIVSGNGYADCRGTIRSDGYNLLSDSGGCVFKSGPGDILDVSARLDSLKGQPPYLPLLPGPGVNGGNPDGCTDYQGNLLETDQRGEPRFGRCDMGAYEYQAEYNPGTILLPVCLNNFCPDFADDFSSTASGWPTFDDDYVHMGYLDGAYRILSKKPGIFYWVTSPACPFANSLTEVEARWQGDPGLAYGIMFVETFEPQRFYLFAVNSQYGVFWLDYYDGENWQSLVDFKEHEAIKQGTNLLRATRDGQKVLLDINNERVSAIIHGDADIVGWTGLFMISYNDRARSDARFDNFATRDIRRVAAAANAGYGRQTAQPTGRQLYGRPGAGEESLAAE